MYSVYIDHPYNWADYKIYPGAKTGSELVSLKFGVNAEFICNSYGNKSKGDVYQLLFDDSEDVTAFLLKCEYKIIPNSIVEKFKSEHRKRGF
jgi:hypothetical protein